MKQLKIPVTDGGANEMSIVKEPNSNRDIEAAHWAGFNQAKKHVKS